ncbi:MAG: hypothetical protein EBQ92_00010 [Proteobacteria bacterium]|jgi:hypothetical protein|nr:hypothetical protein [Pseudomonadota bacterium]
MPKIKRTGQIKEVSQIQGVYERSEVNPSVYVNAVNGLTIIIKSIPTGQKYSGLLKPTGQILVKSWNEPMFYYFSGLWKVNQSPNVFRISDNKRERPKKTGLVTVNDTNVKIVLE